MSGFKPDKHHPETQVWHQSNARAIASGILAIFIALLVLGGVVAIVGASFAQFSFRERVIVLLILGLLTWLCAGLAWLCWRQARGQFRMRIALAPDAIRLDLPRDRSLIHRPSSFHREILRASIARLLVREEAFASQMMAMLQQTYWLELKSGERILLFEDRALASPYATPSLMPVAEAIATDCGVAIEDLPVVEGKGGLLGAWWTTAPVDDAMPVTPKRLAWLDRRIAFTGLLSMLALGAVILSMIFG